MEGAAHPRIVQRLFLIVDPDALDHALIEGGRRQTRHILGFAGRDRIGDANVVAPARQYRRAQLGRKRYEVIKFDAVEIGQPFVPVTRVLLENPNLVLDIADGPKGPGPGITRQYPQIVIVVLERLLPNDHIPAAGDREHDKAFGARLGQFEFDRIGVLRIDLGDRFEQDAAWDADALRRLGNAVEGRLHVVGGQFRAVVKLHPFAQEKRVGRTVLGDLPAVSQVGDDRLATVERVVANEIVEHRGHRAERPDRSRLVDAEMWRAHQYAVAQHAAALRVGFGGLQLKFRAVELVGYLVGMSDAPGKTVDSCDDCGTALQNTAAGPGWACETRVVHAASSLIQALSSHTVSSLTTA